MMVKRNGFSLIELIIAMVIGSIVSVMLYRIFQQSVSVMMILSGMMEDYSNTLIFINQLERDCASVALVEPMCKEQKKATSDKNSAPSSDGEGAQQLFSASVEQGALKNFSMITTNALPQIDHASSWLVRVTYRLAEQPDLPNTFQLLREEAPYDIKGTVGGSQRAYPVLTDIVRLKVTLYVHEFREGSQELRALGEWKKRNGKDDQIPAPEFIKFEGACRTHARDGEEPFSAVFALPAVTLFVERQRQALEQKKSGKQEIQKNEVHAEEQGSKAREGSKSKVAQARASVGSVTTSGASSSSGDKNRAVT